MAPLVLSEPPAEIAFGATVAVWAVAERVLTFQDLRSGAWRSRQDRGSFLWVVTGILAGFGLAVVLADNNALRLPFPVVWVVVGLVLTWAGLVLRFWAVLTLGRYFTTRVLVQSEQRVVTTGPYRLVRHPSYLGLLMLLLGLGLALGDLAGTVAIVVLPTIGLVRRIVVEEEALRSGLGDGYVEYSRGRSRLIPGVW